MKLHLGCGRRHIPGYVHIDVVDYRVLAPARLLRNSVPDFAALGEAYTRTQNLGPVNVEEATRTGRVLPGSPLRPAGDRARPRR